MMTPRINSARYPFGELNSRTLSSTRPHQDSSPPLGKGAGCPEAAPAKGSRQSRVVVHPPSRLCCFSPDELASAPVLGITTPLLRSGALYTSLARRLAGNRSDFISLEPEVVRSFSHASGRHPLLVNAEGARLHSPRSPWTSPPSQHLTSTD